MAKGKKGSKGKGKGKAAKKPASAPKKAPKRGPSKAQKAQAAKVSADAKKVEAAAKSVEGAAKKVEAAAKKVESDAKKAKPKAKSKSKASKKAAKSGSKAKRKPSTKRSAPKRAAKKRPAPKPKTAKKSRAKARSKKSGSRKGKGKGKSRKARKASKKRAAPRRSSTQSKSSTTIKKSGKSGRVKTTRKSSITKVWLKNPVNNWKNVAALATATAFGYVATDVLDRFLATMAPKAEGDKKTFGWTYGAAVKRIGARPNALRMGAQFGLAAVAFGGAMWAQKKSEPAAYALIGLSLGAGVHLLSQVATKYLMPMIFKVDPAKLNERSIGARLYASEQDFVQTPLLEAIKAEDEKPASSPNQADDGKGNLPAAGSLSGGYVGRPGTPVARGGLPTAQARVMEPKARPRTSTVAGCSGCKAGQMEDAYDGPTATAIPGAGPDPMPRIPEAVVAPDAVLNLPSASVAPDQVMTMPRESTAPRGVSGVEPKARRMSNEAFLLLGDPSVNRDPFARKSN